MSWLELALALALATALSLSVAAVLRRTRLRGHGLALGLAVLGFFALVFAVTSAFGGLLAPIGSPVWGISWLSFLFIGLTVVLLLALSAVPLASSSPTPGGVSGRTQAIGVFLAILLYAVVALVAFAFVTSYLA
jgi:hypothetical protein